jgi:hypothetical protein
VGVVVGCAVDWLVCFLGIYWCCTHRDTTATSQAMGGLLSKKRVADTDPSVSVATAVTTAVAEHDDTAQMMPSTLTTYLDGVQYAAELLLKRDEYGSDSIVITLTRALRAVHRDAHTTHRPHFDTLDCPLVFTGKAVGEGSRLFDTLAEFVTSGCKVAMVIPMMFSSSICGVREDLVAAMHMLPADPTDADPTPCISLDGLVVRVGVDEAPEGVLDVPLTVRLNRDNMGEDPRPSIPGALAVLRFLTGGTDGRGRSVNFVATRHPLTIKVLGTKRFPTQLERRQFTWTTGIVDERALPGLLGYEVCQVNDWHRIAHSAVSDPDHRTWTHPGDQWILLRVDRGSPEDGALTAIIK